MSYGILVVNGAGYTQIDGTYDNVAVYASGTTLSSYYDAPMSSGNITKVTIPAGAPDDYLVFAKPTNETGEDVALTLATYSDGTIAFFNYYSVTTKISVDWVIAVRSRDMSTNDSTGYGLVVYKSNGEQAYHSENQNFRCRAVNLRTEDQVDQTNIIFSLTNMSGVYSMMNGKTMIGRVAYGPQFSLVYSLYAVWGYDNKTIATRNNVVLLAPPVSSTVFGGGTKTSLIGTFA